MLTVRQFLDFKNEVNREINLLKSSRSTSSTSVASSTSGSSTADARLEKIEKIITMEKECNSQIQKRLQDELDGLKKMLALAKNKSETSSSTKSFATTASIPPIKLTGSSRDVALLNERINQLQKFMVEFKLSYDSTNANSASASLVVSRTARGGPSTALVPLSTMRSSIEPTLIKSDDDKYIKDFEQRIISQVVHKLREIETKYVTYMSSLEQKYRDALELVGLSHDAKTKSVEFEQRISSAEELVKGMGKTVQEVVDKTKSVFEDEGDVVADLKDIDVEAEASSHEDLIKRMENLEKLIGDYSLRESMISEEYAKRSNSEFEEYKKLTIEHSADLTTKITFLEERLNVLEEESVKNTLVPTPSPTPLVAETQPPVEPSTQPTDTEADDDSPRVIEIDTLSSTEITKLIDGKISELKEVFMTRLASTPASSQVEGVEKSYVDQKFDTLKKYLISSDESKNSQVRHLQSQIASNLTMITQLRKEMDALKSTGKP